MVFTEGQEVYFMYRVKRKHRNAHMWKVEPAIVVSDKEKSNSKVVVKTANQNSMSIRRKLIFDTKEKAEQKCDYWNHWNTYHKRKQFSGNN